MLRTPVGLALGAVVVLGIGAVAAIVWKILGDISEACRWTDRH